MISSNRSTISSEDRSRSSRRCVSSSRLSLLIRSLSVIENLLHILLESGEVLLIDPAGVVVVVNGAGNGLKGCGGCISSGSGCGIDCLTESGCVVEQPESPRNSKVRDVM